MRMLGIAVALAMALCGMVAPAAAATIVYKFTGSCTDCTDAVGTLTLKDYTPGTPTSSQFVTFSYSSSVFAPGALQFDHLNAGTLPLVAGPANVLMSGIGPLSPVYHTSNYIFVSHLDGSWTLGIDGSILDYGDSHSFALVSATPLPASSVFVGTALVGLLGLALAQRRQRNRECLSDLAEPA